MTLRLALCFSLAMAGSPARADLLIRNVTIASPERARASTPVSVHIDDRGRIAEIAARPSRRALRARRTIDGDGHFLAPGLIDGHTHLDEIPGMIPEQEARHPEIAAAARRQLPLSYLYHGFTTVIDLNGRPGPIAAWNAAPLRPQAYYCGGAPVFDGYPMSYLPRPLRYRIMPYFLFDPARADAFPAGFDPAAHSPEAVTARMQGDGAICVKTYYEPGFGGAGGLPVPSVALIRRLAAAAHARHMPLLLHANSQAAQAFGLEAGVDAFVHGIWKWDERDAAAMPPGVAAVLDAVAARRLGWQPTFQVLYGERDLFDPAFLSDPALAEVLPRSLIDWYSAPDGQWWRTRMLGAAYIRADVEADRWQRIDADAIERLAQALAYLARRDARLLFGSDTPSDPTYANPPGLNGRRELGRWIAAGATPAQAFRAATIANAEFFGLDREIGTVAVGKRADLILLARNPMTDATAYDTIEQVIVNGRPIARATLSAARR